MMNEDFKGVKKFIDNNHKYVHCEAKKIDDCLKCEFRDECLIFLIISASTVEDLHLTPIDGKGKNKIIRNGKILDE